MLMRSGSDHLTDFDDSNLLAICHIIPWASFQNLSSLSCSLFYEKNPPQGLIDAEINPSKLFLAGPSRLPRLRDFRITYEVGFDLLEIEQLNASLDSIFLYNLDRTIEDSRAFPALQTFQAQVECVLIGGWPLGLKDDQVIQLVVDRLPAVFGRGGRRETHDWVTSITVVQHLVDESRRWWLLPNSRVYRIRR